MKIKKIVSKNGAKYFKRYGGGSLGSDEPQPQLDTPQNQRYEMTVDNKLRIFKKFLHRVCSKSSLF